MSKTFKLPAEQRPLFDLVSYARGGPRENGGRFTQAQIDQIRRTVQHAPEVVVKVLPKSATTLKSAAKHIDYISRDGEVELETDDGQRLSGLDGKALMEEWDLDLDEVRRQPGLAPTGRRQPPKLIHKLVFSMPAGTPPDKVLSAVRNFAREEFALQHRYVLGLHIDEAHPHVHLVLKAVSEQGIRLNIRNATRRHWRARFAQHLRLLGVPANATERAVRGQIKKAKKDGIYRASLRGASIHIRTQAEAIASELLQGKIRFDAGQRTLIKTRRAVEGGWLSLVSFLAKDGHRDLANDVRRFVETMPVSKTEREQIATELLSKTQEQKICEQHPIR